MDTDSLRHPDTDLQVQVMLLFILTAAWAEDGIPDTEVGNDESVLPIIFPVLVRLIPINSTD